MKLWIRAVVIREFKQMLLLYECVLKHIYRHFDVLNCGIFFFLEFDKSKTVHVAEN